MSFQKFRPLMNLSARAPSTPFIARTLRLQQRAALSPLTPRSTTPMLRGYSTSQRPGSDTPKFRYLFGIVVLSSIGFYFASRSLDKKAPVQYTEADYEAHKRKVRLMYKKSAFTPAEAAASLSWVVPALVRAPSAPDLVRDYGFVHLSAGDLLREEQSA